MPFLLLVFIILKRRGAFLWDDPRYSGNDRLACVAGGISVEVLKFEAELWTFKNKARIKPGSDFEKDIIFCVEICQNNTNNMLLT